jgi:uncharacterized protein (DUF2252 family)
MARDPFAFFRGSNHLYAEAWRDLQPPDVGPAFPICGDLHLENFGAFHDDKGDFLYDINDFDEALFAPCSLDLVRCATSILLAAELWRLTPLQASGMVLEFLENYRSTVAGSDSRQDVDARVPRLARGPIWDLLGKVALATQAELLDRNTERRKLGTRRITRNKYHPTLQPERFDAIRAAVETYGKDSRRPEFFKTLDVTGRIAGVGSLGQARYLALVAGGGTAQTNRLFDIKECLPSSLRPVEARPWPFPDGSEAARVVRAQRLLQASPIAGLDVLEMEERSFRVREMIPAENRSSLDRFNKKPAKLRAATEEAGQLTALSHLRGANAVPGTNAIEDLTRWAAGAALDSVLAAAVRFAERTRVAHRLFRAELRSRQSPSAKLRTRPSS